MQSAEKPGQATSTFPRPASGSSRIVASVFGPIQSSRPNWDWNVLITRSASMPSSSTSRRVVSRHWHW